MKTNLIKVFVLKELKYWKRTWGMNKKFNILGKIIGFPIAFIIITICHFAFAFMHFVTECLLWVFARPIFKANLLKLQSQALA